MSKEVTPPAALNFDQQIQAEIAAEAAIRRILLDLEAETGKRVSAVRIDPGCLVEVFMHNQRTAQP